MTAIHHQNRWQACLEEFRFGFREAGGIIIGPRTAATQNEVTNGITGSAYDAGDAILVDAEKTMLCAGRNHGIEGDLQAAVSAIFESDRHGQAASHFTMSL